MWYSRVYAARICLVLFVYLYNVIPVTRVRNWIARLYENITIIIHIAAVCWYLLAITFFFLIEFSDSRRWCVDDGMTNSVEMNPYLEVWKCRLRLKKSAEVQLASSTLTWDLLTRTDFVYNLPNNDIRVAHGSDDIVACISGREFYAILRVSRAVSMRWPRADRGVLQKSGTHEGTRRRAREHH